MQKSVTEVVPPAPVLERDDFRYLVKEFYSKIDQSGLLDVAPTRGTCSSIGPDDLDSDDLVKILTLLSTRLRDTYQQSAQHLLDPYLVYQAAYAYQALLCVPGDVSLWQATLRRTGKALQGVSGLASAVKGMYSFRSDCLQFQSEVCLEGWHDPTSYQLACLDKPEQDTIPKQLRKCEFTEPQIRELKLHHAFILIHGYDEHQQTNNLYASNRLNQLGEWRAKMVISCRSEYLGVDYRDRFQPEDRNA
ncbi:MAG: hypothetical protein J3Q66DRAFT_404710 [Benniella sp.]|nr:MAG: hypothetical protein J3Q66DRAFT_404710 [Benniella sp.]